MNKFLITVALSACLWLPLTVHGQLIEVGGQTMGTSYKVKLYGADAPSTGTVEKQVQAIVDRVDAAMSTYRDDSEVVRFNSSQSTDWFDVSSDTANVVAVALEISEASDGAFDVTVGPLVEAWGFGRGRSEEPRRPPSPVIEELMGHCGFQQLHVRHEPPAIRKDDPQLRIDLSAIAKGYAVDQVFEALADYRMQGVMVEIGGEVRAGGHRPDGGDWRIGIESPVPNVRKLEMVQPLVDSALASSGDYRNFFELDGQRFSHTIDPRTGQPVTHNLTAVSVITKTCVRADAWATACMVLGADDALSLAAGNNLQIHVFTRDATRNYSRRSSDGSQAAGKISTQTPETSMFVPIFIVTSLVFGIALLGMAVGVIIGNRRLQGSCGGIASLCSSNGGSFCESCGTATPECESLMSGDGAACEDGADCSTVPNTDQTKQTEQVPNQ